MITPEDENVIAVQELLRERARIGLIKYGFTTERTDLTRLDWLIHARAEALDLAVYLTRLIRDEEMAAEIGKKMLEGSRPMTPEEANVANAVLMEEFNQ